VHADKRVGHYRTFGAGELCGLTRFVWRWDSEEWWAGIQGWAAWVQAVDHPQVGETWVLTGWWIPKVTRGPNLT
jgi:hypothetical protein